MKFERRLGHQHEIDFLQGQAGLGCDESRFPAHELDHAHAARSAQGFYVGAADGFGGFFHGRVEAEGAGHEVDVVVDGLRDAHYGDLEAAPEHFAGYGLRGLHGAVAADHEQNGDVHVDFFCPLSLQNSLPLSV